MKPNHLLSLRPHGTVSFLWMMLSLVWQYLDPGVRWTYLVMLAFPLILGDLERVFYTDWREGRLEWWLAEGMSPYAFMIKRLMWYVVLTVLPVAFCFMGASVWVVASVFLTLMSWVSLGLVLAILMLGTQRTQWLLIFLMLPLAVPSFVLIFGLDPQGQSLTTILSILGLQFGLGCVNLSLCLAMGPVGLRWSVA